MANITITNLPAVTSLNGTEDLPAVQSGVTVRLTTAQIAAYTASTFAVPSISIGNNIGGSTPGNGLYVNGSSQLGQFPYGSGVFTALQTATTSTGGPVLYNGAGGTPSSLTLTNATGLPMGGLAATGTPGATNFLRGDGTWSIPSLIIASTTVTGATNGYVLYNNAGLLGAAAPTAATLSIGSPITGSTSGYGLYVDASTQLGQFAYGTGVRTALGVNVGLVGAPVLFNGAGGKPSSIDLTNAASLTLPVGSISATGTAGITTYLRGDGAWASVSGGLGTVTSVSFTGGIVTVNTPTAAASLVIAGTSGGIPYFSSGTTWASSPAAMALNGVMYGGGAAASPASTAAGTTGQVLIATTSNAPSWGQVSLTAGVTGTLPVLNGGTGQSTALTQYGVIYGALTTAMGNTVAGTTGQVLIATTSAAPSWGQVPIAGGGTGQTTTALGTIVVGASASTTTNLGIGSTSQVLTVVGGTAAWATPASGGVSTITFGSTGLTPATATSGAVSVAGTLAVGSGGTGLATTPANGALDIGNGTGFTRTTLTAGTNITITNGSGSISIAASGGGAINVYNVTTSGTWTKPSGYAAGSRVYIQVWGGGGGGGRNTTANFGGGGGGGGAYSERWMTLSDLSATETVTIGAGGTGATATGSGNPGGTTTFGSRATAYGGGFGASGNGGGGGGFYSAASGLTAGTPRNSYWCSDGTAVGGCCGANDANLGVYSGGGAGGAGTAVAGRNGAAGGGSVWGGGGGGGKGGTTGAAGAGGVSLYGGSGGASATGGAVPGVAGSAPGGGGGGCGGAAGTYSGGAGASGQVIVTVFPA